MSDDESNDLNDKILQLQDRIVDGSFQCGQVSAWDDDIIGIEDERNPNDPNERKILEAAENNDIKTLEQLLDENISLIAAVDKDGYSPLHRACYNGHSELVELLIRKGADIHKKTVDGWTPLHSACKWNNTDCVHILLNYGADVNAVTNGGLTPLHLAASVSYSRDILIILLYHPEINTHIVNSSNETAQQIATRSGPNYDLFEATEPCFHKTSSKDT